jgi:hypothetical protein
MTHIHLRASARVHAAVVSMCVMLHCYRCVSCTSCHSPNAIADCCTTFALQTTVAQPVFNHWSTVAKPLKTQMCVLDPDGGIALGTVTADTRVECVCVHPCVLQTFSITDAFLEGVKSRATSFPEDLRLDNLISAGALWAGAKRQLTHEVRCVRVQQA